MSNREGLTDTPQQNSVTSSSQLNDIYLMFNDNEILIWAVNLKLRQNEF